jgi:hypothetical protein
MAPVISRRFRSSTGKGSNTEEENDVKSFPTSHNVPDTLTSRVSDVFKNPYKPELTVVEDFIKSSGCIKPSKKMSNKVLIRTFVLFAMLVITWKLLHRLKLNLYENRPVYLFLGSRSALQMWAYMMSPLIDEWTADVLWDRFRSGKWGGHRSEVNWYDPAKHDNEYRKLRLDVVNTDECATLREMISKNLVKKRDNLDGFEPALVLEFHDVTISEMLMNPTEDTTEEEKALFYSILERIQKQVEIAFDNPDMYIEYGGPTMRSNDVPRGWWNFRRRWWFSTSSGHGTHADQCELTKPWRQQEEGAIINGWWKWLQPYEFSYWNYDFECHLTLDHCCYDRTHSALFYLNDPNDNSLVGGNLYLFDRKDLGEDAGKPSYSGAPLAKQAENVLMVKPTCGTLIMFASDSRNLHGTMPISSGSRFAIPMWFTAHSSLPQGSHHGASSLTHEELELIEEKAREACQRVNRASRHDDYPPPSGLKAVQGDCDEWLKKLRDPDTLLPYESPWGV